MVVVVVLVAYDRATGNEADDRSNYDKVNYDDLKMDDALDVDDVSRDSVDAVSGDLDDADSRLRPRSNTCAVVDDDTAVRTDD